MTVLRDGALAGKAAVGDLTIDAIIRMMVGREVERLFAHRTDSGTGAVALTVEGIARGRDARDPHAVMLHDVGLQVRQRRDRRARRAGRRRAHRARPRDLRRRPDPARPRAARRAARSAIRSPIDAIRAGIGLVPEDRKQQALFLSLAIRVNLSVTSMDRLVDALGPAATRRGGRRWSRASARSWASAWRARIRRSATCRAATSRRWCWPAGWRCSPKVLIVDEPTRGIDVAAKAEVHSLLYDLAGAGIAILAISSELPEILTISDRI